MRRRRTPLRLFAIAISLSAVPAAALAAPAPASHDDASGDSVAAALQHKAGALRHFYAGRGYRPLWIADGRIGPSASILIGYLETARDDGLSPSRYDPDRLRGLVADAQSGDPEALARAEIALSTAFARYVQDQRKSNGAGTHFADPTLRPKKYKPEQILRAASFPKSLRDYMGDMQWMSPQYVTLRGLMADAQRHGASGDEIERLTVNLDRARILPGPWIRHIEVDASSGRLFYYEAGKQAGTMRVVVGAEKTQTPLLAGSLQWAILDPYWNIPDYLAQQSIAKKVLSGRSLTSMHMEALSDWSANARKLSPSEINWQAVADGSQVIRIRELPWAGNSMGRVKFVFPNDMGIYLHDTPERELLTKPDRHFSNGCIRLQDAATLGRWLLGRPLPAATTPERAMPLPVPVPVYLTYITATASGSGVAFRDDVYGRDRAG